MIEEYSEQWVNSMAWREEFEQTLRIALKAPMAERVLGFKKCQRLVSELIDQGKAEGILPHNATVLEVMHADHGLKYEPQGLMPWLVYQVSVSIEKEEDQPLALELVRHAHQLGCDVNQLLSDEKPSPGLFFAVMYQSLPIMDFLLEHGAKPNGQHNEGGLTPLMGSINGYFDNPRFKIKAVKLLFKHGADPNETDDDLKTAMHHAMHGENYNNDRKEIIHELLIRGTLINPQDAFGNTPLHDAYLNRESIDEHYDFIEYLIKNGASLVIKNNQGKAPFSFAMKCDEERHQAFAKEWAFVQLEQQELESAAPQGNNKEGDEKVRVRL